jgi:transcriptional regulator of nitric oxide reductase
MNMVHTDPARPPLLRHGVPLMLLLAVTVGIGAQSWIDQFRQVDTQKRHLESVLPDADRYEFVDGTLPHFRAYTGGALTGLAFFTNELDPKVYGYKTQFWMMVGVRTSGVISGVSIDYHAEPFGYFSVDPPEYVEQFKGKSIMDPLEVGNDIDAVSRATITTESATRAIRQGSRQLLRQYLSERRK